jgi:hypothetical protein
LGLSSKCIAITEANNIWSRPIYDERIISSKVGIDLSSGAFARSEHASGENAAYIALSKQQE